MKFTAMIENFKSFPDDSVFELGARGSGPSTPGQEPSLRSRPRGGGWRGLLRTLAALAVGVRWTPLLGLDGLLPRPLGGLRAAPPVSVVGHGFHQAWGTLS